ncbi:ATP-dependent endonuclease [Kitasatospora herbaricolor]|uniref:ATP-dependent nuclease n=1 Tax=Kitasatospora herbaricolor TaxID=68217 RepID=UPI0036D922C5
MTVFIGPNNSGKSMLLRELAGHVLGNPPQCRWVADVDVQNSGSADEFLAWLHERGSQPRVHPVTHEGVYPSGNPAQSPLSQGQVIASWNGRGFGGIGHYLVSHQDTMQRMHDQTNAQAWDADIPPAHPTQYLYESREAQTAFSQLVQEAFGAPIAINRYEQQIRLQVGAPGLPDEVPPISPELRAAYRSLPVVGEQGDGFRSFVNLLLHTLVRPTPVIIIDEPEAFLHPPQARLLGRFLAERTPSPCQVFVATHSADFISGVLEATAKPVALIRISRAAGSPRGRVLEPEAVTEILRTPVLRYSNIISGLFHDGVVLCESEGDCQFYASTFDALKTSQTNGNLVFLHTNGKARLSDTARRLRQCGIPVAVIADLDLLNDRTLIRNTLDSLGGLWGEFEPDLLPLERQMRSTVTVASAQTIKQQIDGIIGNVPASAVLTSDQADRITSLLKGSNGWKALKRAGLPGLTGTDAYAPAQRMITYLASRGVFVVPVGELEGWVPAVPSGNKSRWLTRVFEENHHNNPSEVLSAFCEKVLSYLVSVPMAEKEDAPAVE